MNPTASDGGGRPGRVEPVDRSATRRLGWPNGPWLLVALGALVLAITGWDWATLLPADPRWFWLTGLGGAGGGGSLVVAARRPRDGFGVRWPATTMGLLVLVAVATFFALPVDESVSAPVVLLSFAALIAGFSGGLATLVFGTIRLLGRRWDGLVALGLLAAAVIGLAAFDPMAMRLRGPAGDRLSAEAEALSADPSAKDASETSSSPFVVAGTGRRVVAWRMPRFDTEVPLLVHDPDGLIGPDDLPDAMAFCGHITGPWWSCTYG